MLHKDLNLQVPSTTELFYIEETFIALLNEAMDKKGKKD